MEHHLLTAARKVAQDSYAVNVSLSSYPFLRDHCLNHNPLVPASWYLDAALLVAKQRFGLPCALKEIRYPKGLLLIPPAAYQMRLEVREKNGNLSCAFYSDKDELCASCDIEKLTAKTERVNLEELRQRCPKQLDRTAYYQLLAEKALNFGPLHQGVARIFIGKDEAIGEVHRLPELGDRAFFLHPSFLDAFSHIGLSLLGEVGYGSIIVTASQERFELYAPIPDRSWCHAQIVERKPDEITVNVSVYSEQGELVARVARYRLKTVPQFDVFPELYQNYQLAWKPAPLVEPGKLESCLFLSDDDLLSKGMSGPFKPFAMGDLNTCIETLASLGPQGSLLVYLRSHDDVAVSNSRILSQAAKILQAIAVKGIVQLRRVAFIGQRHSLGQASLAGFCQVANQESPLLHIQLIEFDRVDSSIASLLELELSSKDNEQQVYYNGATRLVLRLEPIEPRAAAVSIDPNGTYLITGGLGGIGSAITQWLLDQKAKEVVLLSRSQPNESQQKKLTAWNSSGPRVRTVRCDVSDATAVQSAIQQVSGLKGIFHAAGLNRDEIISKLTDEQIDVVLQPKIRGTINLHQATKDIALDHFVLFSSVTSFLGTSGVANYAAANSFLNTYAEVNGLKAVLWGPWEQGMLTKLGDEVRSFWIQQGFTILSDSAGTRCLAQAMALSQPVVAVMAVDWTALFKEYTSSAPCAVLTDMMQRFGYQPAALEAANAILKELKELHPDDRLDRLKDFCIQLIQDLTGTPVEDTSLPFMSIGLDSLTSVEMTKRLQNSLLIGLSPTLLYNYTSIDALAEHLLNDKLGLDAAPEQQGTVPPETRVEKDAQPMSNADLSKLMDDTLDDINDLLK